MHLHLESPGETLWAVVIGAVLATVGGFIATQMEAFVRRRERERSAALLFGEVLSALETITVIAEQARLHGEPYGDVTLRLIRAAQRETQTYERNRALLYDLHDAELRIRLHVLMVQIGLALEGVTDASAQIAAMEAALLDLDADGPKLDALRRRLEALTASREQAFRYALTTTAETKTLVALLQPLAKTDFEALKRFSGNPFAEDPVGETTGAG